MSLEGKLDRVVDRHKELERLLSEADASDSKTYAKLSKEYSDLTPVVRTITALRSLNSECEDLEAMLEDSDAEMRAMAQAELKALKARQPEIEQQLKIMLLPKDAADARNAILEIRAGTGGDEAGLFAAVLFRMYQRYAELRGWKVEVMNASNTGIGGYKEIVASISGRDVFARLKFESGVLPGAGKVVTRYPAWSPNGNRIAFEVSSTKTETWLMKEVIPQRPTDR